MANRKSLGDQSPDNGPWLIFGSLLFCQPDAGERLWLVLQTKAHASGKDVCKLYFGQRLEQSQHQDTRGRGSDWQVAKERVQQFTGLRSIEPVHIPNNAWELNFTDSSKRNFTMILFLAEARDLAEALELPDRYPHLQWLTYAQAIRQLTFADQKHVLADAHALLTGPEENEPAQIRKSEGGLDWLQPVSS